MSSFVFNVACPRCDTAVKIFLGKSEFFCSRCQFQVLIEDKDNLLAQFKLGKAEDLNFVESSIKDPMGTMDTGLKLTFSHGSGGVSSAVDQATAPSEEDDLDVDEFGNKTANTQIIQLTFDPAQYMNRKSSTKSVKRSKNKKISLKKVIKHAEKAKPPKLTQGQIMMRYIGIAAILIMVLVLIIVLVQKK